MNWLSYHRLSEDRASQAEELSRQQSVDRAAESYRLAAEIEEKALDAINSRKKRTIGVMAVSAASLYLKAHEFLQAKRVAHKWLATELLPSFAVEELKGILQIIHNEEARTKKGLIALPCR